MEKNLIKLTENELISIIKEGVILALNEVRERLDEMARVGFFDEYEVYVHTDDAGHVPHFHLRDATTQGRVFDTCIELKTNKYFHHGGHQGILNSGERKDLAKFMESMNPQLKMTNYKATCILWNLNNSKDNIEITDDMAIPNYRTLED